MLTFDVTGSSIGNFSSVIDTGDFITDGVFSNSGERIYVGQGYSSEVLVYSVSGNSLSAITSTVSDPNPAYYGRSLATSSVGDSLLVGSGGNPYLFWTPPPDTTPPTLTLSTPSGNRPFVVQDGSELPASKFIASVADNRAPLTDADVTLSNAGLSGNVFSDPGVHMATWSVSDGDNTTSETYPLIVLDSSWNV